MTAKYKAIIFDFDGTLAATMEDNFKAWQAAVAEYGLKIKPEDYYPMEGLSVFEIPAHLFGKYGRTPPEAQEVVKKKEDHYRRLHCFAFYPEVEAIIAALHQGETRLGIVTSALLDRLRHSIPSPDFLAQFEVLVTADDTREGKPSPAPYLKGLEKFKLKASECLAVENAPLGIESAKRAGLYCIAICSTCADTDLKGADEILKTFVDLRESFRKKSLLPQTAEKKR